ncbi:MAG: DNA starvation/stationary phase protection protein Dps [Verrucomicrobiota bacterium]
MDTQSSTLTEKTGDKTVFAKEGEIPMLVTQNDLPAENRKKLVEVLNQSLADLKDLQTQLKQAHWNVKGQGFIALHELFDEINGEVIGHIDTIAERAVQLGGIALGTARVVASRSQLPEYPLNISESADHVDALSHAIAVAAKAMRQNIAKTGDLGDADTEDIFTEVSRGLDKNLWFVEAHKAPRRA